MLPLQGRGIFTPIYIDNLVDGIVLAAGIKEAAGQIFNLTDGEGIENRHYFEYYARLLGKEIPTVQDKLTQSLAWRAKVIDRVKKRFGIVSQWNETGVRYLCRRGTYSIEKARKLLGFVPHVGINEGMKRTEQWLREEGLV